jgi:hypothetical protein
MQTKRSATGGQVERVVRPPRPKRAAGRAPSFWWDFVGNNCHVLVQSDWPGGEALAIFKAAPGQKFRDAQIERAERLIEDYKAGRKTPPWGAKAA